MNNNYAHIDSKVFDSEMIFKYQKIFNKGNFIKIKELGRVLVVDNYQIEDIKNNQEENDFNQCKITIYYREPNENEIVRINKIELKKKEIIVIEELKLSTVECDNLLEKNFKFPYDLIKKELKKDFIAYSESENKIYFGIYNGRDGDCWNVNNYLDYRVYGKSIDCDNSVIVKNFILN